MSYSMPLWEYLEKLAKAKEQPEPLRQPQGEDYLTDKRPKPIVDWAGRRMK